ncbi:MAG TPA: hypothetical protein VL422_17710 [Miltoncostaea sp.]|nr:hypothetical protein [Miltoncostaea sp.]
MTVDTSGGIAATIARIREITGRVDAITGGEPAGSGFADALQGASPSLASKGAAAGATGATGASATATGASGVTGAQLDAWMRQKNPGSPLIGLGDVFVREGERNGIDPRALVAIARAESSLGSVPGARARNNAFGWGPTQTFASWEDNIATVARGLKTGYLDDGLTTLAQIQRRYAPVGTANDPANLNSNWLRNTTLLYGELGGDPNGSVALGTS